MKTLGFCLVFVSWLLIIVLLPSEANAGLLIQRPLYIGLTNGLVGFWSFDGPDVAGNVAYDRSGQGNNGTLTNGPVRTAGRIGQSLNFDGVDDYVDIGAGPSSINSVSFWVYPKTTTEFFINITGTTDYISSSAGTISATGFSSPTIYVNGEVSSVLTANQWQHIVVTTATAENASNLDIGRTQDANNLEGVIDEVRIYSRVLTPDEIKRLYRIGATLKLNKPTYTDSLQNGLVGFWSFDGPDVAGIPSTATSPGTAYDRSGQGNNGRYWNATGTLPAIGRIGQALEFDGSNDYVGVDNGGGLNNLQTGTISMWVRWSGTQDAGFINFGHITGRQKVGTWSNQMIGLSTSNPSTAGVVWHPYDAGAAVITGATSVGDNVWRHVVVTYASGSHRLYLDGAQDGSSTQTGTVNNDVTVPLTIGAWIEDGAGYSKSVIDDVRIYNRVLSADEIKRLYRIGATLKLNKPTYTSSLQQGLAGYWSFDGPDMAGNIAYDRSANNNNGTLTNGPTRAIGRIGQTLDFDGVDDYVSAGSDTTIDDIFENGGTASLWYNIRSLGSGSGDFVSRPLSKRNGSGWLIHFTSGSRIRLLHTFNSGAVLATWEANYPVVFNEWVHFAMTYDRSSTANDPVFYINGSPVATTEMTAPSGTIDSDGAGNLFIGASSLPSQFVDGRMDEIRLYKRILTPDEIKRLYNFGR